MRARFEESSIILEDYLPLTRAFNNFGNYRSFDDAINVVSVYGIILHYPILYSKLRRFDIDLKK